MKPPTTLSAEQARSLSETSYWWWMTRLTNPSFVYSVQSVDPGTPIKIGVAKDVPARIVTLQTGNPSLLIIRCVVPGSYEFEWQLHHKLRRHRVLGEWFQAPATEPLLVEMQRLDEAMRAAYDDSGLVPTYRQPGFMWPSYRGKTITIRHIEPVPVTPELAAERLRAAWMMPRGGVPRSR